MLKRRAGGAALIEFYIVALLALLPFTMAILQTAVLVTAHNVLNHATSGAARAGAMNHARRSVMEKALARGLLPLHASTTEELTSGNVNGIVAVAYARALADVLLNADLEILNPTSAAFADFGRNEDGVTAIRNDSLEFRDLRRGARSGQTILEANLLQIRVRYCYPLIFPMIDRLLLSLLRSIDAEAFHQRCYATGRVPLTSTTGVQMQSDPHLADS